MCTARHGFTIAVFEAQVLLDRLFVFPELSERELFQFHDGGFGSRLFRLQCVDDKKDGHPIYRNLDNHVVEVWTTYYDGL